MNQLEEHSEHWHDQNAEATEPLLLDRKQMREDLKRLEQEFGPDSIEVAEQLFDWGCDYMAAGRLGEAENLFKQAMSKIEKYYGADYPAMATVAYFMWYLYLMQDRPDEGRTMLLKALSVAEQVGDETLYWTITVGLIDLARYFIADEELTQAASILFRVLESTAHHHVDSPYREYVSIAANDWTDVHKAIRENRDPSIQGTENSLSPEELSAKLIEFMEPTTFLRLARSSVDAGDLEEAESFLETARELLEAVPNRNECQMATISTELALLKAELGKKEEARKISTTATLAATWSNGLDLKTQEQLFSKHADVLTRIGGTEEAGKASELAKRFRERIADLRKKSWSEKIQRLAEFVFRHKADQVYVESGTASV